MTKKQVFVFLDWQNVYMRAREAFHDPKWDEAVKGQVDPIDLAHVLTQDFNSRHDDADYELGRICIYRGRPVQQHDNKGYAAVRRQTTAWSRNKLIEMHARDLRYPEDWGQENCIDKPREKGVDVALALDVVTYGRDGLYDGGIVMSADYDLAPALDYMVRRRKTAGTGPIVEVAAWKSDQGGKPLRIRLDAKPLYCIWLDRQTYWGVVDETDYTVPTVKRTAADAPKPGQWLGQ